MPATSMSDFLANSYLLSTLTTPALFCQRPPSSISYLNALYTRLSFRAAIYSLRSPDLSG